MVFPVREVRLTSKKAQKKRRDLSIKVFYEQPVTSFRSLQQLAILLMCFITISILICIRWQCRAQ